MPCWCKGACPIARNIKNANSRGRGGAAERIIKTALIDAPNCVEANIALADILTKSNRAHFADVHLARAGKVGGMTAGLAAAAAENARGRAEIPQSIALYAAATEAAPGNLKVAAAYVSALEAAGDLDAAENFCEPLSDEQIQAPEFRRAYASYRATRGHYNRAAELLTVDDARPLEILDRGRYKDRAGDYAGAFADWTLAKGRLVKNGSIRFDRDGFNVMLGDLALMATKKRQAGIQKAAEPTIEYAPAPLFVTGYPRSGTTMVETAIAAHPKIIAGDELPFLPEVTQLMPRIMGTDAEYPLAMLASSWGENVAGFGLLRDWYIRRARQRLAGAIEAADSEKVKGAKFFTDKMVLNEIHLPLILRLFPKSPVFYVRRHPLDVVLSNLSYYYHAAWGAGASLRASAYAYRVVDELVQTYKAIWPGKLIEVRYEFFVARHVAEIDRIFDHLGMKADPQCYDFHDSGRWARTVSHRQIKEPVYDRSVGRWKNYRDQLAPVIEELRPIIEREGYEL